jgi:hypothetical protein
MNATKAQFIETARLFGGIGTFASMTIVTEPKLLAKNRTTKAPRPFQKLTKVQSFVNGQLGGEFEKRVKPQRKREGIDEAFEASKASGRTRINALLSHKDDNADQLYLTVYIDKATMKTTAYVDENDNVYVYESVKDYLNLPKSSNGKQGLENEIKVIAPKLESITAIIAFGNTYDMTT